MPRGSEPLGDIATVVLFENERVKIWSLVVQPGQASAWHLHTRDYITVLVEGRDRTLELEDGATQVNSTDIGSWTFQDQHVVHRVVNHSDARFRNILIELKDRGK